MMGLGPSMVVKDNLEKEYLVVVEHLSLGALLKKIIQKISQIW